MEAFNGHDDPSRLWPSGFWLFLLGAVLVTAAILAMQPSEAAINEAVVATHSNGVLHVTIPYQAAHAGMGQLTVEVLNPEDQVLGRSEQRAEVAVGKGRWEEEIKLEKTLAFDDLVWQRMRYRFEYSDRKAEAFEGTESIAQILRTPVVHILGQQSYLSGGQAAVRVIVTDSKNELIAGPGTVRIELMAPGQKP